MAEDFTGRLKRFLTPNSSKLKHHRSAAQGIIENEIYLKKTSYFQRLKLDLQLFHMEATTTSLFTIRKAFLLFMAVPSSIIGQYYFIMEVFYKVFVFDVGRVRRKKVLPLNFPEGEDISYWPMWRVFVEHYLLSFDFWILFTITSFIVYGVVLATASTNFLWSSDPDTQEKNLDKSDFFHMALQVSLKSKGEIAYVYEFKRIEVFLKSEVYLHLLSLDVHAFLGTMPTEEINKKSALLMYNLEYYLEQVAYMILQLKEYDALLLKEKNFAARKKMAAIKELYKHIYDFETSENVAKVYEALYCYWLLDGVQGVVHYFEFEHMLRQKAPLPKKTGKEHPLAGFCLKFSQKQEELRQRKGLPIKHIIWRRYKWRLNHLHETLGIKGFEALKKFKEEGWKRDETSEDFLDFTIQEFHGEATTEAQKQDLKTNVYSRITVWNSLLEEGSLGSWDLKFFVWGRKLRKIRADLFALWEVIYDRYFKKK